MVPTGHVDVPVNILVLCMTRLCWQLSVDSPLAIVETSSHDQAVASHLLTLHRGCTAACWIKQGTLRIIYLKHGATLRALSMALIEPIHGLCHCIVCCLQVHRPCPPNRQLILRQVRQLILLSKQDELTGSCGYSCLDRGSEDQRNSRTLCFDRVGYRF